MFQVPVVYIPSTSQPQRANWQNLNSFEGSDVTGTLTASWEAPCFRLLLEATLDLCTRLRDFP
jgi:hypothetical protein